MPFNDPPWRPMKDPVDIKHIGKLIEEVCELGASAARCLIQGIEGLEPETGKPNWLWLLEEMADVSANITLAVERFGLDAGSMDPRILSKMENLRAWHKDAGKE